MKMAVRRLLGSFIQASSLRERAIGPNGDFGFVAARTGAVYSESLGRERDSCGQATIDRAAMIYGILQGFSPMSDLFTLSAPDLAALLCSRVCHDIISPVGAINNGLELLDEGGADEDAMKLIRQSARNASARLQFARIAFGAAGSAGMLIDTGDAEAVAIAFLKNEKPELTWNGTRALLPKNKVKLLLNLILVANAAIPRGGKLSVTLENLETEPRFALSASGPMLRVPPKFLELHSGHKPDEPIDAHSVQPYYTLLLAREANMTISIHATAEEIVLSAA
jgi:histidine phosphotransferase ChpT